ncbi:MAG: hypothetical protein C4K49_00425 [Candidatus Thorarchaeota archaeon]|nr:MAG: hypothetical protein C4K49_00425 [Candidatus Thorarchaeota archaeon]
MVSVLGVTGGVLVFYNQSAGLHWEVELGDEITYAVRVMGFSEYWPFNGSFSPPYHVELNNTYVTIRIDGLPEIPSFPSGETFAEGILSYVKTSITGPIEYGNGTEVVSADYSFLNNVISQSILPVGNWPFIDSLYPDMLEPDPICDTYFSSLNASFMIGHRMYLYDAGSGWYATVDMSTGLPTNATVWACQYYGYTFYSYEVTLTPSLPSPH